ncbi:hypothetical protein ABZW32_22815 [Streptomyces sp. NPDC004667]|uniref:MinD/ParA family ATP-binding protein n=1 Tax=Streptomyces sp. NPDC004667 TaxID=3154285 RepID=UPI0033B735D5
MSQSRRDDWQAGVLGELTGAPSAAARAGEPGTGQGQGQGPSTPAHSPIPHHPGNAAPAQPTAPDRFPAPSAQAEDRGRFPGAPGGQPQAEDRGRFTGAPGAPAGTGGRGQVPQGGAPYPYPASAPAGAPQGIRAPETVPVPATGAAGRPRHGDPAGRRALRALRGALGSSAARAVAIETGLATQVQQPVTTGRQIVVTSIRGGSGKTTVTALLSRTYNHYRHDPVLTLEADAALGTLPVRLGVESLRWTCGDVAQIVRPSMQLTDITGYLVPLADGGWLLPGSQGRIGAQVDVATYRTVMVALRRYFGVTVVDCETLPGEVARTALDTAHARVLTTPATAEGLVSTHAVLDWLASLPVPVLPRTVVVLTCQSPHPAVDLGKAAEKLRATGAGVVVLPYDRHLASGGAVRTELLGAETRQAAVRLAADVLQRALALPAAGAAR